MICPTPSWIGWSRGFRLGLIPQRSANWTGYSTSCAARTPSGAASSRRRCRTFGRGRPLRLCFREHRLHGAQGSRGGDAAPGSAARTPQLNPRARAMLDFAPNHVGLDHPWVDEHPEHFITATESLDERLLRGVRGKSRDVDDRPSYCRHSRSRRYRHEGVPLSAVDPQQVRVMAGHDYQFCAFGEAVGLPPFPGLAPAGTMPATCRPGHVQSSSSADFGPHTVRPGVVRVASGYSSSSLIAIVTRLPGKQPELS